MWLRFTLLMAVVVMCGCVKMTKPGFGLPPLCPVSSFPPVTSDFKNGFNFVSYEGTSLSSRASRESLSNLKKTSANWIAIVITACQRNAADTIFYDCPGYASSPKEILNLAQEAKKRGFRIMLKFQVDLEDESSRRSGIGRNFNEDDWHLWFAGYSDLIFRYLHVAGGLADIICIGNELTTAESRANDWRVLISRIRELYNSYLVYSVNWNPGPRNVTWWDALDYAGISAFYGITQKKNPTREELIQGWQSKLSELEMFYNESKIPVIFTEIGYKSIDGANIRPWFWQSGAEDADLMEQADLYYALYESVRTRLWLNGIFWWGWEANPRLGGLGDTNYTPYGKPAEKIIPLFSCIKR